MPPSSVAIIEDNCDSDTRHDNEDVIDISEEPNTVQPVEPRTDELEERLMFDKNEEEIEEDVEPEIPAVLLEDIIQ
jgi:hypothetical protein